MLDVLFSVLKSLDDLWIRIGTIFSLKSWIRIRNTFQPNELTNGVSGSNRRYHSPLPGLCCHYLDYAATAWIVPPLYLDWSACNSFAGAATRSLGLGFAFCVILCRGVGAPHLQQHRSQCIMSWVSIPASSDTVESEGRQMKQSWISYIKNKKKSKIIPPLYIMNITLLKPVLRIRIRSRRIHMFWASWIRIPIRYLTQRYGSGSFDHQAKIVRKPWFLLFCNSFWLLSLKNE